MTAHTRIVEPEGRPGSYIDAGHPTVLAHADVHQNLVNQAAGLTLAAGVLVHNPYGTAPLSAVFAASALIDEEWKIEVFDRENEAETIVTHTYAVAADRAYVLPILGLLPETDNIIRISGSRDQFLGSLKTAPLPPADNDPSAAIRDGFPQVTVTSPFDSSAGQLASGMYFVPASPRNFIAFDDKGRIRWYLNTTDGFGNAIPTNSSVRLTDGTFIASAGGNEMWRFDMAGRIVAVYILSERAHHSLLELSGEFEPQDSGHLLLTSEWVAGREPDDEGNIASEDCLAIVNLQTGEERTWYDLQAVFDIERAPFPRGTNPGVFDWAHTNQAYLDECSQLFVFSCRHQGIGAIDRDGNLKFIVGSHEDWTKSQHTQALLTPVDADGNPLYQFPDDYDLANKEFWNWGQHCVTEMRGSESNIIEFWVCNNGNYRSRDISAAVVPSENYTSFVKFRVDYNADCPSSGNLRLQAA